MAITLDIQLLLMSFAAPLGFSMLILCSVVWYVDNWRFEKRVDNFAKRLDPIWNKLVSRHKFTENRRKEKKNLSY